jgi:flagellar hook-length control protein FliK
MTISLIGVLGNIGLNIVSGVVDAVLSDGNVGEDGLPIDVASLNQQGQENQGDNVNASVFANILQNMQQPEIVSENIENISKQIEFIPQDINLEGKLVHNNISEIIPDNKIINFNPVNFNAQINAQKTQSSEDEENIQFVNSDNSKESFLSKSLEQNMDDFANENVTLKNDNEDDVEVISKNIYENTNLGDNDLAENNQNIAAIIENSDVASVEKNKNIKNSLPQDMVLQANEQKEEFNNIPKEMVKNPLGNTDKNEKNKNDMVVSSDNNKLESFSDKIAINSNASEDKNIDHFAKKDLDNEKIQDVKINNNNNISFNNKLREFDDIEKINNIASANFREQMAQKTPSEQVAFYITKGMRDNVNNIKIQLHPRELGKVDVNIRIDAEGMAKVFVSTDKMDTLNLLRSDTQGLEKMLDNVGIKTSSNNISFDLMGGNNQSNDNGRSNNSCENNEFGMKFANNNLHNNDQNGHEKKVYYGNSMLNILA